MKWPFVEVTCSNAHSKSASNTHSPTRLANGRCLRLGIWLIGPAKASPIAAPLREISRYLVEMAISAWLVIEYAIKNFGFPPVEDGPSIEVCTSGRSRGNAPRKTRGVTTLFERAHLKSLAEDEPHLQFTSWLPTYAPTGL